MTKNNINLSDFGFMELNEISELIKAYLNEKNKGNDYIWLKKIRHDNTIPKTVLISDDNKQYEESNGLLKEVSKEDRI